MDKTRARLLDFRVRLLVFEMLELTPSISSPVHDQNVRSAQRQLGLICASATSWPHLGYTANITLVYPKISNILAESPDVVT